MSTYGLLRKYYAFKKVSKYIFMEQLLAAMCTSREPFFCCCLLNPKNMVFGFAVLSPGLILLQFSTDCSV